MLLHARVRVRSAYLRARGAAGGDVDDERAGHAQRDEPRVVRAEQRAERDDRRDGVVPVRALLRACVREGVCVDCVRACVR